MKDTLLLDEDFSPLLFSHLKSKITTTIAATAAALLTTAAFPTIAALPTTAFASIGAQAAKTTHWNESYIVFD
jgi:hypothetical protein